LPPHRRPRGPLGLVLAVVAMAVSLVLLAAPQLPLRVGLGLDAVCLLCILALIAVTRRR
jgi:hypothetical protein